VIEKNVAKVILQQVIHLANKFWKT